MTITDDDKSWLMEAIGNIVAAANTTQQRDLDLRFDRVDERFNKIDERFDKIDERFDKVDERLANQESDILAIRTHTAALSRDVMSLKNRKDREQQEIIDRVAALEAAVAALQKTRSEP